MPFEDFNAYTEVDPTGPGRTAGHIQWTADGFHADFDAYMDETAYFYKDKGIDFFGDFAHKVDVCIEAVSGQYYIYGVAWMVSNNVANASVHDTNEWNYIRLLLIQTGPGNNYDKRIRFQSRVGYVTYSIDYVISLGTWYYLTIERTGSSVSCKVYSDSARTNLLTTLTITCPTTLFRYLYACNTKPEVLARWIRLDIENLDVGAVGYIEGITRDVNGNPLGNCTVRLFRSTDKLFVLETTSNENGYYSFQVSDTITEYFIRAHKDGTPNVFGTTDDNLTGS